MSDLRTRTILVALAEPRLPSAEQVQRAHETHFPSFVLPPIDRAHSTPDTLSFRSPNVTFHMGLLPASLPREEVRDAAEAAWYWPEAAATLRGHRAHAAVSASSTTLDSTELMLMLTRVVSALATSAGALGIYVQGARALHKVDDFVSEGAHATREQLPLYLWLRFSLGQEGAQEGAAGLTLYTTGLAQFELMELEFAPSRLDPQTLMDRAFNIAHYLIERGAVLRDGHTIGTSANERFRVKHAPSVRPGHGPVYRIEIQDWEQQVPQA